MTMEVKALQQMLAQFRQVQEKLEKQIDEISVEASAGGGMVTVRMNGQKQLTQVHIEPEVFKSKDQEMLQELVLAAVNEATRRVDEELSKQVKDLTGGMPGIMGMKIPGLF
jgi:DNA-binding YbaB/EbfC family protein